MENNYKHSKEAKQVEHLAVAIGANPSPKIQEIDDLEYFVEKLRRNITGRNSDIDE